MTATWITGDTLTVLRAMPSASVDMVMTSPPFLALRSYLPDDDPAKAHEIGQEATPGEFLDVLLDITEELRRVLAPHGSICVELGDTYSGSGGAGGDYAGGGLREGQQSFSGSAAKRRRDGIVDGGRPPRRRQPPNTAERHHPDGSLKTSAVARSTEAKNAAQMLPVTGGEGWPADKSLCLIPELYRFALAYGFNPLTGRTTPRWRIRNVIRWVRPNPPVGALGDKFRPGTSDMVIATGTDEAGRRRYFDLDAVRTPYSERFQRGIDNGEHRGAMPGAVVGAAAGERVQMAQLPKEMSSDHAGAPPLDWWEIPTTPYKGSHYATYPPALVERPVKAMCPQRVCTTCGEPSRRIVDVEKVGERRVGDASASKGVTGGDSGNPDKIRHATTTTTTTTDWTDCGHNTWRPGIVLDPFGGSGTTLAVATGHGRDAIGIDLDARNADLARERIGPMFFTEATVDELCPKDGAA